MTRPEYGLPFTIVLFGASHRSDEEVSTARKCFRDGGLKGIDADASIRRFAQRGLSTRDIWTIMIDNPAFEKLGLCEEAKELLVLVIEYHVREAKKLGLPFSNETALAAIQTLNPKKKDFDPFFSDANPSNIPIFIPKPSK